MSKKNYFRDPIEMTAPDGLTDGMTRTEIQTRLAHNELSQCDECKAKDFRINELERRMDRIREIFDSIYKKKS